MKTNFLRTWIAVLGGLTACFLLAASVSSSYASQEELEQIQKEIRAKGKKWVAMENRVSSLPDHERKLRLGLLKAESFVDEPAVSAPYAETTATLPATFDWRNHNDQSYVTGIRDQGSCGSCWAFATTAALESSRLITDGTSSDLIEQINLAEQILLSCSKAGSCSGGYVTTASDFLRDTGLPDESYYPYTETNGKCANALAGWQSDATRITGWQYAGGTPNPTLAQIKNALITYGPLVTTFDVYTDFYYYSRGIYEYVEGTLEGGHAVLIVGYDDTQGCFIVKNSWGEWGDLREPGYFRIGYSQMSNQVYFGDWSLAYGSTLPYTPPDPPAITVSSPNGGESWLRGTTQRITWNTAGNPGAYAKIELLKGGALVKTLTSRASIAAGAYSWRIPVKQPLGNDYSIRITSTADNTVMDSSDGVFAIIGK